MVGSFLTDEKKIEEIEEGRENFFEIRPMTHVTHWAVGRSHASGTNKRPVKLHIFLASVKMYMRSVEERLFIPFP
jgi:hypothetical protein